MISAMTIGGLLLAPARFAPAAHRGVRRSPGQPDPDPQVPLVVSEHMSPFPFDDMRGADGRPFPDVLSPLESAARVTAIGVR